MRDQHVIYKNNSIVQHGDEKNLVTPKIMIKTSIIAYRAKIAKISKQAVRTLKEKYKF